ncbi:MAG TPA: hypothetical protein VFQ52_05525, partial [Rhizomicrobium sp.]|nr:hypothetical protein [Rhizomicrobium sp.]
MTREGGETKLSFGTSTLFDRYQYYTASHSEARASLAFGCLRKSFHRRERRRHRFHQRAALTATSRSWCRRAGTIACW